MSLTVPDECTLEEALARCSPWHRCRASDLYVGKKVLARLREDENGGSEGSSGRSNGEHAPTTASSAAAAAATAATAATTATTATAATAATTTTSTSPARSPTEKTPIRGNTYVPARVIAVNTFGTYSVQFIATKDRQQATALEDIRLENPIEKDNFDELLNSRMTIFLRNGVHDLRGRMVHIDFPVALVGASQNKTIVRGGFRIGGPKIGRSAAAAGTPTAGVHFAHLTLCGSSGSGIYAFNGLGVTLKECVVTQHERFGVMVFGAVRARLENVQVTECGESGVVCHSGGEVYLAQPHCAANKWAKMAVTGNCTKGGATSFGLDAGYANGRIFTVRPLCKERIASGNGGGGDWAGNTIRQVESDR